jgi:hypothetical protein
MKVNGDSTVISLLVKQIDKSKTLKMNFLGLFIAIFCAVALFMIALNIGYIFKKKEFAGSCSSKNPMVHDKIGNCPVCGKTPEEDCKLPEEEKRKLSLN